MAGGTRKRYVTKAGLQRIEADHILTLNVTENFYLEDLLKLIQYTIQENISV